MKVLTQRLVLNLDAIDSNLKFLGPNMTMTPLYNNATYRVCHDFMHEKILIQFSLRLTFALDIILGLQPFCNIICKIFHGFLKSQKLLPKFEGRPFKV